MTTNNATETTTVINNFINVDEFEIREQIAQEIETAIKDAQIRKYQAGLGDFTSQGDVYWRDGMKEAVAIARGQK